MDDPEIPEPPIDSIEIVSLSILSAVIKKLPASPAVAIKFVENIFAALAAESVNPLPPQENQNLYFTVELSVSSIVPFLLCLPIPPSVEILLSITLFGLVN